MWTFQKNPLHIRARWLTVNPCCRARRFIPRITIDRFAEEWKRQSSIIGRPLSFRMASNRVVLDRLVVHVKKGSQEKPTTLCTVNPPCARARSILFLLTVSIASPTFPAETHGSSSRSSKALIPSHNSNLDEEFWWRKDVSFPSARNNCRQKEQFYQK